MDLIKWNDVHFQWEDEKPIFKELSMTLSGGINGLIGQNGVGKSTFMLLSAGRILPQRGSIYLLEKNTADISSQEELNLRASFVYQNMEFETDQALHPLLEQVLTMGNIASGGNDLLQELRVALELELILEKRLQEMSKGEMQRAILAFSLLYGSPVLFLDEPLFALEDYQKEKALEYLKQYAEDSNIAMFLSLHQLKYSSKYSHNALLFYKGGMIKYGKTEEILIRKNIEEAFQCPIDNLRDRQKLFRESLLKRERDDLSGSVKVYD